MKCQHSASPMIKEGGMLSMLKNLVRFLTSSRTALTKENTAMSGIKACEKIKPNTDAVQGHLAKAIHNFEAMTSFHDLQYSDWSASASFYALYHGLLAILAQCGYESRNQSCTFALVEDFIMKGEMKHLTLADLKEIFDKDVTVDLAHSNKILDIRERMQYSTRTMLAEEEFQILKKRTKELFDKIRLELERFTLGTSKLG